MEKNQEEQEIQKDGGEIDSLREAPETEREEQKENSQEENWESESMEEAEELEEPEKLEESEKLEDDEQTIQPKKKFRKKTFLKTTGIVLAAMAASAAFLYNRSLGPKPPAPDVVAEYNGKQVTVTELDEFVKLEDARSREHIMCDVHGYDHSKCDPTEDCEQHPIDDMVGYRQAVTLMLSERIVSEWAESKGISNREEVQHGLKDLLGDANAYSQMDQIYHEEVSTDSISKWEIQQYYDQNRDKYGDKALSDVEEEIQAILLNQKRQDYMPAYISGLKETAGLVTNFDLLKIPEPVETNDSDDPYINSEYEAKKTQALFSVHGKNYTLEDFYREFKELPEETRSQYNTVGKKQELVEMYITKELLLEESSDQSQGAQGDHDMEELKLQYMSQVMHQENVDDQVAEPTEEEMQKFYDDNLSSFEIPEKVKINMIWIGQTEDGAGKTRAEEALSQIRGGADFTEIAKQYSEDGTAANGGVIDEWFYRGLVLSELENSIFKLNVGETSEIIESQGGYYLIQLREREDKQTSSYEESKETVKAHIKSEKHAELEANMENEILDNAGMVIYDRTIRRLLKERQKENA